MTWTILPDQGKTKISQSLLGGLLCSKCVELLPHHANKFRSREPLVGRGPIYRTHLRPEASLLLQAGKELNLHSVVWSHRSSPLDHRPMSVA
jgi:hypothetical protein